MKSLKQLKKKKIIKGRKRRDKTAKPEGYDSWFEFDIQNKKPHWNRETIKVSYVVPAKPRTYHPDFQVGNTLIEVKGRFRTPEEFWKYEHAKPEITKLGMKLVFIFEDPNKPLPDAKLRKDNTKRTHGEWARDVGFDYYTADTLPVDL